MKQISLALIAATIAVTASALALTLLHTLGHDDLKNSGDSEGTFSWK